MAKKIKRDFRLLEDKSVEPVKVTEKFTFGNKSDAFHQIKLIKPVFAFDFISLEQDDFSFNGKNVSRDDHEKLMKALKEISSHTYEELNHEYKYHFHEINWNEVRIKPSVFFNPIYGVGNKNTDELTAYQFKVFQEARVDGFIYNGVFYLVLFDRNHKIYKRK